MPVSFEKFFETFNALIARPDLYLDDPKKDPPEKWKRLLANPLLEEGRRVFDPLKSDSNLPPVNVLVIALRYQREDVLRYLLENYAADFFPSLVSESSGPIDAAYKFKRSEMLFRSLVCLKNAKHIETAMKKLINFLAKQDPENFAVLFGESFPFLLENASAEYAVPVMEHLIAAALCKIPDFTDINSVITDEGDRTLLMHAVECDCLPLLELLRDKFKASFTESNANNSALSVALQVGAVKCLPAVLGLIPRCNLVGALARALTFLQHNQKNLEETKQVLISELLGLGDKVFPVFMEDLQKYNPEFCLEILAVQAERLTTNLLMLIHQYKLDACLQTLAQQTSCVNVLDYINKHDVWKYLDLVPLDQRESLLLTMFAEQNLALAVVFELCKKTFGLHAETRELLVKQLIDKGYLKLLQFLLARGDFSVKLENTPLAASESFENLARHFSARFLADPNKFFAEPEFLSDAPAKNATLYALYHLCFINNGEEFDVARGKVKECIKAEASKGGVIHVLEAIAKEACCIYLLGSMAQRGEQQQRYLAMLFAAEHLVKARKVKTTPALSVLVAEACLYAARFSGDKVKFLNYANTLLAKMFVEKPLRELLEANFFPIYEMFQQQYYREGIVCELDRRDGDARRQLDDVFSAVSADEDKYSVALRNYFLSIIALAFQGKAVKNLQFYFEDLATTQLSRCSADSRPCQVLRDVFCEIFNNQVLQSLFQGKQQEKTCLAMTLANSSLLAKVKFDVPQAVKLVDTMKIFLASHYYQQVSEFLQRVGVISEFKLAVVDRLKDFFASLIERAGELERNNLPGYDSLSGALLAIMAPDQHPLPDQETVDFSAQPILLQMLAEAVITSKKAIYLNGEALKLCELPWVERHAKDICDYLQRGKKSGVFNREKLTSRLSHLQEEYQLFSEVCNIGRLAISQAVCELLATEDAENLFSQQENKEMLVAVLREISVGTVCLKDQLLFEGLPAFTQLPALLERYDQSVVALRKKLLELEQHTYEQPCSAVPPDYEEIKDEGRIIYRAVGMVIQQLGPPSSLADEYVDIDRIRAAKAAKAARRAAAPSDEPEYLSVEAASVADNHAATPWGPRLRSANIRSHSKPVYPPSGVATSELEQAFKKFRVGGGAADATAPAPDVKWQLHRARESKQQAADDAAPATNASK